MLWNVLVLVCVLLLATVAGLLIRRNAGHFRGAPHAQHAETGTPNGDPTRMTVDPSDLPEPLGERATLLQFSSAFCAPCRATRRILGDVAAVVPGVTHIEIDAEHNLDLVRRIGVLRTPTTLVLDATGLEVSRASGTPTKPDVVAALGRAIPDQAPTD